MYNDIMGGSVPYWRLRAQKRGVATATPLDLLSRGSDRAEPASAKPWSPSPATR